MCNSADIVNALNRADSILHHHLQCTGGFIFAPNLVYKSLDYSQYGRGKTLYQCYFFLSSLFHVGLWAIHNVVLVSGGPV